MTDFDLNQLEGRFAAWLGRRPDGPQVVELRLARMESGQSNLTFRVDVRTKDGQELRYLLRVDPIIGIAAPYDMSFQFHMYELLAQTAVPVPEVYWLETDRDVIGREFWVGEFVPAHTPPRLLPLDDPLSSARAASFVRTLASIHDVDWRGLAIDRFCPMFGTEDLKDRILVPLERSGAYLPTADQVLFEEVCQWLLEAAPPIDNPVLNHGDTTLSNFLYRGTEVAAVVDWERAMITDRLWDIAFHCAIKWRHRTGTTADEKARERLTFLDEYRRASGADLGDVAYWEIYANYATALVWTHPDARRHSPDSAEAYTRRLRDLVAQR
jgi:aminoglycoside phosphotransferase (APT) family kinase protein